MLIASGLFWCIKKREFDVSLGGPSAHNLSFWIGAWDTADLTFFLGGPSTSTPIFGAWASVGWTFSEWTKYSYLVPLLCLAHGNWILAGWAEYSYPPFFLFGKWNSVDWTFAGRAD